jgi:hypothetical protein
MLVPLLEQIEVPGPGGKSDASHQPGGVPGRDALQPLAGGMRARATILDA